MVIYICIGIKISQKNKIDKNLINLIINIS